MKAPFRHIKGIASGSHGASEKIRLPFHTAKCGQGTVDNMILQDTVQLCWGPARSWLSPPISFVGKPQLVLHVLSNPFSKLGWKPAQDRVSSPVNILQPSNRGRLLVWHCQLGAWFLAKFNPAGFEKVDVQANTTTGTGRVGLHITRSGHNVLGIYIDILQCTKFMYEYTQYIYVHYRGSPAQVSLVHHGHQRRVADP
jgi:hypothetical protein